MMTMNTALTYPLGRPLLLATVARRRRLLPLGATPQAQVGEQVRPEQPIAEAPGPGGGRVAILAGLAGRVVEVGPAAGTIGGWVTIEGVAMTLHGVIGLGGAVVGPLEMLPRGEALAFVVIPRGGIILYPQQASLSLLQRAVTGGAVGVIAASMSARELEAFARADLSGLLDGLGTNAPLPPLTVLLTEGLGNQPMRQETFQALAQRLGDTLMLTGTTDPQRNLRPEALASAPGGAQTMEGLAPAALVPGARAQVAAGPRRGQRGEITHVLARGQGAMGVTRAPSALLRFEDGSLEVVALHALDRVG